MVERFPDKKEVHSSILCAPTKMNAGREIDISSHEKFLNLFQRRHFKGNDFSEVEMTTTGFARDFYANDRSFMPTIVNFVETVGKIARTARKLRKKGQIGQYAETLLIARSLELAFFGKHHLLY